VKFGIRELLILLVSISFVKIGPMKAIPYGRQCKHLNARVPWNRKLFWMQRKPQEKLCTASQSTIFAVLFFSFSSWNV